MNGDKKDLALMDTTNMHNQNLRTKQLVPSNQINNDLGPMPPNMCYQDLLKYPITKCDRVEVIRRDENANSYHDGYPTYLLVDGKMPHETDETKKEKEITLFAEAGQPFSILVKWKYNVFEVLQPKLFSFDFGILHVSIVPERQPCRVTIGGFEPMTISFMLRFAEGERPVIHLATAAGWPPDEVKPDAILASPSW